MLQTISWYQFFNTLGGAIGLYYVVNAFYFYSQELKAFFKGELTFGKRQNGLSDSPLPGKNHQSKPSDEGEGQTILLTNDDVIGSVSDLIEEIKSITLRHQSIPKKMAESLFTELLKRYHSLMGTHYQETISLFIADTLTDKGEFVLDKSEVQRWWPVPVQSKKTPSGIKINASIAFAILLMVLLPLLHANAQDGNAGINEATMRVRSFFATGVNLTYAIGAIIGLIGAVKVYQKWNSGDPDTGKVAASWFGSCVFLVITATVLRSFFGV